MEENIQQINLREKILALLIDYCVCFAILLFCIVIMLLLCMVSEILTNKEIEFNPKAGQCISLIGLGLFMSLSFGYYSHFLKRRGQTLGERIAGIQVIPKRGERISLFSALKRCFFFIPPFVIFYFVNRSSNPPLSFFEYFTGTHLVRKNKNSKK
ncbi:MAG: RDD family protein [Candidatus Omnitrophica bacterium]|nr:RDD family protein [Candidatus Omnitrophota bacterium]